MKKLVHCESCGAEFEDVLPKCPYCGMIHIKGAEAEYWNQLKKVREDLEELKDIPEEEIKKEVKKQGGLIGKVLVVVGIIIVVLGGLVYWMNGRYERDNKADYLWKQENFPIMDQMYEEEDYEALIRFYVNAENKDKAIWDWQHFDFLRLYLDTLDVQEIIEQEKSGKVLSKTDYVSLFYMECSIAGASFRSEMEEDELKRLEPYTKDALSDFSSRWNMSQTDYDEFMRQLKKQNGFIDYDLCEEYIEKWYQKKEE